MSLKDEMVLYTKLSGRDGNHTPIGIIGAYLDGYEKGKADQPQWIPCSERLPEEKINPNTQSYDWVLCSTTFGDVRAYHFGRGRFLHGCGDVTQYVTAWMPMPEPYHGEGEQK